MREIPIMEEEINMNLIGKTFEINTKDLAHNYAETLKAIADYVGQEYTHGRDNCFMVENVQDYNFIRPKDLAEDANQFEIES
jgi:predicted transcriptional regulator